MPKTPEQRQRARELADRLQAERLGKGGDFTSWFEALYSHAGGDSGLIPWGDERPHPALVKWAAEHGIDGRGKRAVDIGCGLGDNAAFLASLGFETTAIDISPSAIDWAARRFPGQGIDFRQVDLFALPENLKGRFDLVHETYTLQAIPPQGRGGLFEAVADLLAPGGVLLVICRARPEDMPPEGPPWPLCAGDLEPFDRLGLVRRVFREFDERKEDGRVIPHFLAEYERPA